MKETQRHGDEHRADGVELFADLPKMGGEGWGVRRMERMAARQIPRGVENETRLEVCLMKGLTKPGRTAFLVAVAFGLVTVSAGRAWAAPGDLDLSFGVNGAVTTDISGPSLDPGEEHSDVATSVALQADGRIVAVGRASDYLHYLVHAFAVVRYNTNGSVDNSFGNGGRTVTSVGALDSGAYAVAVQGDGKILAAGRGEVEVHEGNGVYSLDAFAVLRYNPDGSLDSSFGSGGEVLTVLAGPGESSAVSSVLVQADGKIVAAGFYYNSRTGNNFALVRYNSDGTLDDSFGSAGKVVTPVGTLTSAAIQSDGKIVVVGRDADGQKVTLRC